ncbi:hypothetical protein, partial [Serratia marcescens]|uniref:hypothetical protein n=1 Tax=Serratia marcescens TaxID=615 RepID=UPI001952E121
MFTYLLNALNNSFGFLSEPTPCYVFKLKSTVQVISVQVYYSRLNDNLGFRAGMLWLNCMMFKENPILFAFVFN